MQSNVIPFMQSIYVLYGLIIKSIIKNAQLTEQDFIIKHCITLL